MSEPRNLLVLADGVHAFPTASAPVEATAARALLIGAGRILALGDRESLRALAPDAEQLDLRGTFLTPGLTDSHIHFTEWALARREVDLRRAASPQEAARIVTTSAPDASGTWLRGRGWNGAAWGDDLPHRRLLDGVDRPVALQSHDMHALWVNGAALSAAGIHASTPDPPGGRIVRDADGEPTGLLLENAAQLVSNAIPAPAWHHAQDAALHAQAELHRLGITGIHSLPGIHTPEPDPLPVLEALRAQDRLRLRVLHHIRLDHLDDAIRLGLRSGFGGEWIRVGGVKMFLDGTLGSRTAWMRSRYENGDHCGMCTLEPDRFRGFAHEAARAGIATTVHAIGDAAVALALETLADPALPRAALPHRIEHVQCCPLEALHVAGGAGIICSVQPAHLITDWPTADRNWGESRCRGTYAFASLSRHGATLAFGSDAPVEPVDPRLALFAATERRDPEGRPEGGWYPGERITLEAAFRAYTNGPARAAGAPGLQGELAPGAVADLVAWEGDPLAVRGAALLRLRAAATIVGGVRVHG